MRLISMLLLCLVIPITLNAGDAKTEKVQELDVKAFTYPARGGSATRPIVLVKAEDLKKLEEAGEFAGFPKKSVNFEKHSALVFAWAGSGGDRIQVGESKGDNITFVYSRGLTRDLRQHLRVFAIPKGAKWQIEIGKFE